MLLRATAYIYRYTSIYSSFSLSNSSSPVWLYGASAEQIPAFREGGPLSKCGLPLVPPGSGHPNREKKAWPRPGGLKPRSYPMRNKVQLGKNLITFNINRERERERFWISFSFWDFINIQKIILDVTKNRRGTLPPGKKCIHGPFFEKH